MEERDRKGKERGKEEQEKKRQKRKWEGIEATRKVGEGEEE